MKLESSDYEFYDIHIVNFILLTYSVLKIQKYVFFIFLGTLLDAFLIAENFTNLWFIKNHKKLVSNLTRTIIHRKMFILNNLQYLSR